MNVRYIYGYLGLMMMVCYNVISTLRNLYFHQATNCLFWGIHALIIHYVSYSMYIYLENRIQEIYDWVFEVDSGRTEKGPVRLSFSLEYEMTIKRHETYGLIENKVGARIQIQDDDIRAIVPVVKVTIPGSTGLQDF